MEQHWCWWRVELCCWTTQGHSLESWRSKLCYDNKDHRTIEEERCLGKIIKRSGETNVEPSIETRNRTVPKVHGKEGIWVQNF